MSITTYPTQRVAPAHPRRLGRSHSGGGEEEPSPGVTFTPRTRVVRSTKKKMNEARWRLASLAAFSVAVGAVSCTDLQTVTATQQEPSSNEIEWLRAAFADADRQARLGDVVIINRRTRSVVAVNTGIQSVADEFRRFETQVMGHDSPCDEEDQENGDPPAGCCRREADASEEEMEEWDECVDELLESPDCAIIVLEVNLSTGLRESYCRPERT